MNNVTSNLTRISEFLCVTKHSSKKNVVHNECQTMNNHVKKTSVYCKMHVNIKKVNDNKKVIINELKWCDYTKNSTF